MNGDLPKDAETPEAAIAGSGTDPSAHTEAGDIDEALLAAELDAEFDEIRAEIDRINLQERVGGTTKRLMLQQYRKARRANRKQDPNRPPWRVRLDDALESTIDKFIEDGLEEKADGSIALVFNSELIGTHGVPLLTALLDAMRAGLKDKEGQAGPMGIIGPHIIQFIENFRTSFAGAPSEDAPDVTAKVEGAEGEAKEKQLPPLSIEDVFKGFSGLIASARANAPKPKGKPQQGKKGGKPQTTTFTMKTPSTPPAGPSSTAGARPTASGDKPSSDGPTINIDFAGLFGSLMKGMAKAKVQGASPKKAASPAEPPVAPPPATEPPAEPPATTVDKPGPEDT